MALVPVIQPPIMKALTSKKDRQIVMGQLRTVSKTETIVLPIVVTVLVSLMPVSYTHLDVHKRQEDILREGDVAVDATMGNGGDTAFLCKLVGKTGHVYAFDVQQKALDRTAARLEEAGMRSRATLILAGHETMRDHVPVSPHVVMFNLGWLPGAEHVVTTKTETTMQAAEAALDLVLPDGFVSICIYPGHEEGARELHALLNCCLSLIHI